MTKKQYTLNLTYDQLQTIQHALAILPINNRRSEENTDCITVILIKKLEKLEKYVAETIEN